MLLNDLEISTGKKWYGSKKEDNYSMCSTSKKKSYCRSDVDILRRCCLKFCERFYNVTKVDPFKTLTMPFSVSKQLSSKRYNCQHSTARIFSQKQTIGCLRVNGCRIMPRKTKRVGSYSIGRMHKVKSKGSTEPLRKQFAPQLLKAKIGKMRSTPFYFTTEQQPIALLANHPLYFCLAEKYVPNSRR